ncbi:16S rRNA (guanine(527)-N(7))-methyltransferase RsmG [Gephyromycinifex aptenodytis]|uniref:16S rRNA (guanine(527)-N(7))-methyltransferase RsmG n=1 Tax=Gephyromycinifex aptenodytis TaxID=2716227 RepID=UPI00144774D8|nr:16S rRNA (guanine(527)-N(7))-methyltransferase RsmG [Gephyromycinifex aptenodytis]
MDEVVRNGGQSEQSRAPGCPPPPAVAERIYGSALPMAQSYAAHLADTGVTHGLIGPREVERLWERHILNCAVVSELIPQSAHLVDVGSGAGLPGLAVAIARPDLQIDLVEPMARRVAWLEEVITDLGLSHVQVHRGRAEEVAVVGDVVTARAVSRLATLSGWMAPLVRPGGLMLALKGASAQEELERDRGAAGRVGWAELTVLQVGTDLLEQPTTVIRGVRVETRSSRRTARRPRR